MVGFIEGSETVLFCAFDCDKNMVYSIVIRIWYCDKNMVYVEDLLSYKQLVNLIKVLFSFCSSLSPVVCSVSFLLVFNGNLYKTFAPHGTGICSFLSSLVRIHKDV